VVIFQISINGKPYCVAEEIGAVTIVAEPVPRRDGGRVSIHARSAHDESLHWLGAHLAAGDEIRIQIIETDETAADVPKGCSFCGRDVHDVLSMVNGPLVSICDGCVAAFAAAVTHRGQLPIGASIRDEAEWRCGFCNKRPGEIPGLVVRNRSAICPECLRACSDMIADTPNA
jgi:hypothetical protein